jgi:hypothetical protein
MPREIALGDALVPGLLVFFLLALAVLWLLDAVAGSVSTVSCGTRHCSGWLSSFVSSAPSRCSCTE